MNTPLILLGGLITSIAFIVIGSRKGLHPFFALFTASVLFGLIAGLTLPEILQSITTGFGSLIAQIGFIVAFGTMLGNSLERSGAMEVISSSIINVVGEKRSVLAMSIIGAIVGIPVFCDSGFIILSKMIPSLIAKSQVSGASLSVALASGLYTTHTLVPPTPGPLAAASNLNLGGSIGTVIGLGLAITIPVIAVSYFFARYVARDGQYQLTISSQSRITSLSVSSAWIPLLIPLLLIGIGSFVKQFTLSEGFSHLVMFITSPAIALLIGIIFALLIQRGQQLKEADWISLSLKEAGLILLITGAGGAFGTVIKASGIEKMIGAFTTSGNLSGTVLIVTAWIVAAVLKTAQGSTTSAMIVSSALIAPLVPVGSPTMLPLLLVFAVSGGAMTVSHANDSYFWVVSQFGGLSTKDMVRRFTLVTFLQGVTVLAIVLILFLMLG